MRNNFVKLFEFGSVVQEEILFKRFLIWSSGGPPVRWSGTICAILKEGFMGNIHVKLYEIWNLWFRRRCCLKKKFSDDGLAWLSGPEFKVNFSY